MPASSSSSTSWKRFGCRLPGAFVCASSSTTTSAGRRARIASMSISSSVWPRYSSRRRGMISSPSSNTWVSWRPCVSTTPTTTSTPWRCCSRAACSIAYVFPTPGAAPTKTLSLRRSSRAACASSASGDGRRSVSERSLAIRVILSAPTAGVERAVQGEDVHCRLAEDAELPARRVLLDERLDVGEGYAARPGHPGRLVASRRRADVGVEPAARRGHEVHRDGGEIRRIRGAKGIAAPLHGVGQSVAERSLVRPRRRSRVVGRRCGGGEASPEITGIVERLADESGPDGPALLHDQAPVRLYREEHLGERREAERVGKPGEDGQKDQQHEGGTKLCTELHRLPHATPSATSTRSIALIPIKGATIPPRP